MNCPSRVDPDALPNGWNQNPGSLALHKNGDLNNRANLTHWQDHRIASEQPPDEIPDVANPPLEEEQGDDAGKAVDGGVGHDGSASGEKVTLPKEEQENQAGKGIEGRVGHDGIASNEKAIQPKEEQGHAASKNPDRPPQAPNWARKNIDLAIARLVKFSKFIGPGFMIAVAYIDPGNYATDVAAGATYRFRLLVMIMASNIIAIFLQSLCIKLGSVTGMDLSQNIRAHCPRWLNYFLYFFAEAAIIATDIAEVLGTAIALNLLINVPLVAGCAISIVDVLIILIFYRPTGSIRGLRWFEIFIMVLVLGVVVCFCIELSLIHVDDVGRIFRGYLPSSVLVESKGLYQACGILGATVMPHSLYLGSGIVQPRLKDYDDTHCTHPNSTFDPPPSPPQADNIETNAAPATPMTTSATPAPAAPAPASQRSPEINSTSNSDDNTRDADTASLTSTSTTPSITTTTSSTKYRPSLAAIQHCMRTSILELSLSLATFALFVNSSILIVAGATLWGTPAASTGDSGNLFAIHTLFSTSLAPFAGTVFALALLLSGTSAGIICTIAGQMVSEGQLGWTVKPWIRRLITRSVSITPSIIVAGAVGKDGVSKALEGTQVALSVILPFVSAPLIWFTCRERYMRVVDEGSPTGWRSMRNGWFVGTWAVLLWGVIVVMNVALLVLAGLGVE